MAATTAAVVGGVASAASAASSMSGGGGGSPKWKRKAEKSLYEDAKRTPITLAPRNVDQLAADQMVRESQGYLDPDMAEAQANAARYAGGVTADDIRGFYNPFEDDVVGSYLNDVNRMHGTEDLRVNDAAERAGAFGGDREVVYRAVSQGEIDRNAQLGLGSIRSSGYDLASRTALQNRGLQLGGNQQLQDLIESRKAQRYGDIGALSAVGGAGQMQDQAQRDLARRRMEFLYSSLGIVAPPQPPQGGDPLAAALHGYQGGYRGVQDIIGAMRLPGGSTPAPSAYKPTNAGPYLPPRG